MTVKEIGRAVERIDNPFVLGCGFAVGAAFFTSDFVVRIGFFQSLNQDDFGIAVNIGNKIVEGFAVGFDGIEIARGAYHHLTGTAGGFKGCIQKRIHQISLRVAYRRFGRTVLRSGKIGVYLVGVNPAKSGKIPPDACLLQAQR